jgi:hypothetical protein
MDEKTKYLLLQVISKVISVSRINRSANGHVEYFFN